MSHVILVRHTVPVVDPDIPAGRWEASATGRDAVVALIPALAKLGIDRIVTSPERKAVVTAEILAQGLDVEWEEAAGLVEQSLGMAPFLPDRDAFILGVREHFARPDEVVFGEESSRAAALRFDRVVREVMGQSLAPHLPVLVSHGRIMSAWIAQLTGGDAFTCWQDLRMPDALMVNVEERTWERISP